MSTSASSTTAPRSVSAPLDDFDVDGDDEGRQSSRPRRAAVSRPRPPRKKRVTIEVPPSEEGRDFVSVHDYLSAVHPVLMRARDDILACIAVTYGEHRPAGMKLMVRFMPGSVNVMGRDDCLKLRGRPREAPDRLQYRAQRFLGMDENGRRKLYPDPSKGCGVTGQVSPVENPG